VGKLVLYLADGTTLDVRLARERITIGRRADNDVCLPYPAVSGEHAAVVTILSDSFLEDLGSTNGTLVNGKPIAKHFLRDRDQIDIGKQKLVYVADESVQLDPAPPSLGRLEARLYGERVEPARPTAKVTIPDAGPIVESGEPTTEKGGGSTADIERFVAAELASSRSDRDERARPFAAAKAAPEPEPTSDSPTPRAIVRVLTGPSAGREVTLDQDETAVGRVGVQVAAVRRIDGRYQLVPLEGATPPSVNGIPVPPEGRRLQPGDSFEVAGIKLEVVERAPAASR
jgi:pSer/pThr/pTyr-binding forkhead associated (FHA) protein